MGLVTAATVYMIYLLLSHNFAFVYVAEYTTRELPPLYLISALWAGNQGALLFWTWLIAIIGVLVVITSRARDRELAPYAAAIVMITEAFLIALLLHVNPFSKMIAPTNGMGMTTFFQNIGMILHPPIVMAAYAGFTVPFALAVAALLTGRLDNDWLITARRWALLSWLLLGAGMLIGAWWKYTQLGEGSYWSWDPVQNAALMPWLSSTAFLHSISMQRKRSVLKVWSIMLIILTFGLVIFGTLLSRSNIIASIHTFSASAVGRAILGFLVATMVVSSILVFLRRRGLESKLQIESVVSKEGTFLLTNLLMVASTLAILLGTIFMMWKTDVSALSGSQAAPFFTQANIPIFLTIILLIGICTTVGWRQVAVRSLGRSLLWPLVISLLLGLALLLFGLRGWYPIVGLAVCCFVLLTAVTEWVKSTRARHHSRGENYLKAFLGLVWNNRPHHGGYIVHIALALIVVGIIGSSAYGVSKEVTLVTGESTGIGSYSLVYEKLNYEPALGDLIYTATLSVYKNNKLVGELKPVVYFDKSFNGEAYIAAIRSSPVEDLHHCNRVGRCRAHQIQNQHLSDGHVDLDWWLADDVRWTDSLLA